MAVVRKKQDDKILKTLRELVSIGGNKQCFDCGQKGPTYINMTIGSFVCTSCSGILRGLTPPHRVKSISMATFSQDEIEFVRQNGNDSCSRTWLGLWDPKRAIKQEHRDFMIDKYERKRYYLEPASPLKSLPTNASSSTSSLSTCNGTSSSNSSSNGNLSSISNLRNGAASSIAQQSAKPITLTPPTSLRLSRTSSNSSNGLNNTNNNNNNNGSVNGNGTHVLSGSSTNLKFPQAFTPDDSNFFSDPPPKILPPTPQKHSSNHHQRLNGGGVTNGTSSQLNGHSTFERSQKNGLLLTNASAANNNKFTPDADFVADFSNANIVNAVTVNGQHKISNGNIHQSQKLSNGFSSGGSSVSSTNNGIENGNGNGTQNGSSSNGNFENFADFEHNTIYNAAGLPIPTTSKSTSISSPTPSVDRYAALKDLDDQFREIKLESEANNNNTTNGNTSNHNHQSNGLLNGNHAHDLHSTSSVNPFKVANPFQQQQQSQQTLSWSIPSVVSATNNNNATNGFYATSPYQQNGFVQHHHHPQQQQQQQHMLNGNVAFHGSTGFVGTSPQLVPQFSNGSMLSQQQAASTLHRFGHGFGNPFVTTATTVSSNSNNPFL